MISYLSGIIQFQGEKFVVLNVNGVGYKVFLSPDVLLKMPKKGELVNVWTHFHVRDDATDLYGFLNFAELNLFELLIGISGVGPKTALGVLGTAPVDTLKKAIAAGDTSYLTKVSGIGRKTAEKIILELREKMAGKGAVFEAGSLKDETDALDALVSLGYSHQEARDALSRVAPSVEGVEKRLKEALKKLGNRER